MVDERQLLQSHQNTWRGYCRLMTWSLIGVVVTLVLMAIFLL